jgi:outer membrane protein assembly factor BamB
LDLSRRKLLLGGGSVAVGAIAAGCGSPQASGHAQSGLEASPKASAKASPKAGTLLWRTAAAGTLLAAAEAGGTLGLLGGFSLRGLSVSNGKETWSLRGHQADYLTLAAVGDQVLIASGGTVIVALDPGTGRQRWRYALPIVQEIPNEPLFAYDSTTVYVTGLTLSTGTPQYYIFAIDAVTGERSWATYFPFTATIGPLTAGDGVVCALSGASSATMIALNAETGAHLWTSPGPVVPFQGAIADGVLFGSIFNTANKSGVVAIDATTGRTLWTANVGSNLQSTTSDGGIAYAGTYDGPARDGVPGEVIALDAHTGKTLWARHFAQGAPAALQPADTVVYTGFDGDFVYALDSKTGDTLRTYTIAIAAKDEVSSIVPTPSTLCLTSLDGAVFALEA